MPAVGVLTLELRIEGAHSLKDKRNVVRSLKDRLRSRYNVSVAEIGGQDAWQYALVAVAAVSSDREHAEGLLEAVEAEAAAFLGGDLAGTVIEWLA